MKKSTQPAQNSTIGTLLDSLREHSDRGEVEGLAVVCFLDDGVTSAFAGCFNRIHAAGYLDLLKSKLLQMQMAEDEMNGGQAH